MAFVFIAIVIGLGAWLFGSSEHRGVQMEEMSVKHILGSTVEERLLNHGIDVSNARIMKIENASLLQQKYSGIFKDAKDGHYLVELPDSIMVYDFEHDEIVARFELIRMEVG
jgi:hypothetical protein